MRALRLTRWTGVENSGEIIHRLSIIVEQNNSAFYGIRREKLIHKLQNISNFSGLPVYLDLPFVQ